MNKDRFNRGLWRVVVTVIVGGVLSQIVRGFDATLHPAFHIVFYIAGASVATLALKISGERLGSKGLFIFFGALIGLLQWVVIVVNREYRLFEPQTVYLVGIVLSGAALVLLLLFFPRTGEVRSRDE